MPRRPIIAGNWKMYKTPAQTSEYFQTFSPLIDGAQHCDVVICPPFVDLSIALQGVQETNIQIGAQNVYWINEGAFTGETSPSMLKEMGVQWVLIGHSERRQYFGETDETVAKKTAAALAAPLRPIICVGEHLHEREAGQCEAVLTQQFQGGLAGLTPEQFNEVVIAYEPVWAIGTGRTATPETAEEAHQVIRRLASQHFGPQAGEDLQILYGGSVKPDNIRALMSKGDIDGALVGGASLDPAGFAAIVNHV